MDPHTMEKVHFLKKDDSDRLLRELFNPEELPIRFGGNKVEHAVQGSEFDKVCCAHTVVVERARERERVCVCVCVCVREIRQSSPSMPLIILCAPDDHGFSMRLKLGKQWPNFLNHNELLHSKQHSRST
jgi:hypothetical protein